MVEVTWYDASWGRMVHNFFLRQINAHGCMRSNLRSGSVSTMSMLRQEASDLGEASRPVGPAYPADVGEERHARAMHELRSVEPKGKKAESLGCAH